MGIKNVSVEQIGNEIAILIKTYTDDVSTDIEKEVEATGKFILAEARRLAPKDRGNYAKNFAIKRVRFNGSSERIIYNKKAGLVHLLEKGHVVRNQYGTYGHTRAQPHLVPAYNKYADVMYSKIKLEAFL
jgi:hypothetical protein